MVGSDELMAKFCIPKHTWEFVRSSWRTNQPSLYSRLDLAYDGVNPPKLLENNADTPTSLYEAAFSSGCGWKTRSTPASWIRNRISTTACRRS